MTSFLPSTAFLKEFRMDWKTVPLTETSTHFGCSSKACRKTVSQTYPEYLVTKPLKEALKWQQVFKTEYSVLHPGNKPGEIYFKFLPSQLK